MDTPRTYGLSKTNIGGFVKKVFISGSNGNMGRRYASILKKLGIEYFGADKDVPVLDQASFCRKKDIDGIIIATSTHTHLDLIALFGMIAKDIPILCEKPILKQSFNKDEKLKLTMVNQYKYMIDESKVGKTDYNYFKSGSDGIVWDCINIIGLANGALSLKDSSPTWKCVINDQILNIKNMDKAYIEMVKDWSENPVSNWDYIVKAHKKCLEVLKSAKVKKSD